MRESRSREGHFPLQLFYEPKEIDSICVDALRKSGFLPKSPEPIKIDIFLEKFFGVVVAYDDLGDGIMGSTVFNSHGAVTGILIARWIEQDGTQAAERRVRSTLAHEGGHGLLHSKLFIAEQTPSLFGQLDQSKPKDFLCREIDVSVNVSTKTRYSGKWWEWQANRAIGGLLLPKPLVTVLASQFTSETQFGPVMSQSKRLEAELETSRVFDVNPVVARIRLEEMYPPDEESHRL